MKRLLILFTFFGLTTYFCDVYSSEYLDWQKAKQITEVVKLPYNLKKVYDQIVTQHAFDMNDTELFISKIQKGALARRSRKALNVLLVDSLRTRKDMRVVQALLNAGADANAFNNNNGETALMEAVSNGDREVIELLLKAEADVNAFNNKNGWTALMKAVSNSDREVIELLLKAGAKVNATEKEGWTALMIATRRGDSEPFELLLQAGAKVNVADESGLTVLIMGRHPKILDLLRPYKALKIIPIAKEFDHEPKPEDYIVEIVIPAGISEQEVLNKFGQDYERLDQQKRPFKQIDQLDQQERPLQIDQLDQQERPFKQIDQQIKEFEQDHIVYWRNNVQEAYKKYLDNDAQPLRTLFAQELYAKFGLLPEIISFFNLPGDFISVLKQLQQGATPEEIERLQKMINVEERGESIRKEHLQRNELMRDEQLQREALREALQAV